MLNFIQKTFFSIVFSNSVFTSSRPKFWIILREKCCSFKKINKIHNLHPQLFISEFSPWLYRVKRLAPQIC